MRFHAKKCKVLSINHFHYNLFSELPFFLFPYQIDNALLDYCTEEKDLGIIITSKFSFSNHQHVVLSKAINQFNLLRRTCHFVKNSYKRRTLYLTLVRSLIEHGSQIWSPSISALIKFENFQKSCVKWILKEQFTSYNEAEYLEKLISLTFSLWNINSLCQISFFFINLSMNLFLLVSLKRLFPYLSEQGHMLIHLTNIKLSVMYNLKRTSCVIRTLPVQYITGIFCQMNVEKFLHLHDLDRQF